MVFTINDKGAPIIRITHDKNSPELEEKLLGLFLKSIKSNNNTLTMEVGKEFHDGKVEHEIKVLGT